MMPSKYTEIQFEFQSIWCPSECTKIESQDFFNSNFQYLVTWHPPHDAETVSPDFSLQILENCIPLFNKMVPS